MSVDTYANVAGLDLEHLTQWIGRSETREDEVTAAPVAALAATLDIDQRYPKPGDPLPPLWHWLYFLPFPRQSDLGPDGHEKRGAFLPPVDLPRRMWAGSRLHFRNPLRVGEQITRISRIADVRLKEGRNGPLVFVLVRHEIANAQGIALEEEHDIVYRGHPQPGLPAPAPPPAPAVSEWERAVHPDDALLFRYSALTFNAHRIHYDRRYATEVEGYPGLVVHGPLIATLLLDLVRRRLPGANVGRFEFRAVSPIFNTADFAICGKPEADSSSIGLWAKGPRDELAVTASALLV
ncbi:MAG: MaoC family dehydratase N-terminal domain-containing protein [Acidobacteriota bacterium]|nr:MaoC family dehydratase N-terminal domain-containing protein [Acidobacteriota bacterium]